MDKTAIDVQLRHVTQHFQNGREPLVALKEISLTIQAGEFVSLVGASGCGKSTLLRLVAGLLTPSKGEVFLAGQEPALMRKRKPIGWMAQRPGLFALRTVLENVRLPLQINSQARDHTTSPIELLHLVGLALLSAYPATLPSGMQQCVALARTLAIGTSLWLIDEPFAALDELTREALGNELLAIWQQFNPTVLWATPHLSEAVRLSDRVILLSPRPGTICGQLSIDLPRPRDDTSPAFQAYVRQARQILQSGGKDGTHQMYYI